jgi:hypothetical protein
MANALRSPSELHLRGDLVRLRSYAATARSLLDELDRLVPVSGARRNQEALAVLGEQLADELARLGCRLLECAASVAGVPPLRSEPD